MFNSFTIRSYSGWVEYGFEAHAKSRGISAEAALKLTKSLSLAKVLENMASNALEVDEENY